MAGGSAPSEAVPPPSPPAAPPEGPGERPATGSEVPAEGRGRRFLRGVRSIVGREDRPFRLGVALALAVGYVGLVLCYTRGGLLYGIDFSGTYSWQDILVRPRIDNLLPSLISGLLPGHIYASFYATFGIEVFLVAFACQSFTRALVHRTFGPAELRVVAAAAAVLYLFSPVLVTYRYVSVLLAVPTSAAAFFLALRYFVEAARSLQEGRGLLRRAAVGLGLAAGLALPASLPNDARIAGLEALAFLGVLAFGLVLYWRRPGARPTTKTTMFRLLAIALPIGFALFLYPVYLFLTNSQGLNFANVGSVAAQYAPHFTNGAYNTLQQTLRLIGRESFTKAPYYGMYQTNPGVILGSALLPALGLAVPLLAALVWKFPDRYLVVPLALVALLGTFWEAGTNPPFGSVYSALARTLPYGPVVFQTYILTALLLVRLFPPLVAFGAMAVTRPIVAGWRRRPKAAAPEPIPAPPRSRRARALPWVRGAAAVTLVVLATLAAWPIYNGAVEGVWGNAAQKGFFVPGDYAKARAALGHGGALLLPEVETYLRTGWGYNGANVFYESYFYPGQVLVPGYYGPYGANDPSTVAAYASATNPLAPPTNLTPLPTLHPAKAATTNASKPGNRTTYHTLKPFSLANDSWIAVSIPVANASQAEALLANDSIWLGLSVPASFGGSTEWYVVGQADNAVVTASTARALNVSLLLDAPSFGAVNLSGVNAFVVRWTTNGTGASAFNGTPTWEAANSSGIRAAWYAQLGQYGLTYLLVDRSVVVGALQSYLIVNGILGILEKAQELQPVYLGPTLQLYRLALPGGGSG